MTNSSTVLVRCPGSQIHNVAAGVGRVPFWDKSAKLHSTRHAWAATVLQLRFLFAWNGFAQLVTTINKHTDAY